jgi:hypothetical protein
MDGLDKFSVLGNDFLVSIPEITKLPRPDVDYVDRQLNTPPNYKNPKIYNITHLKNEFPFVRSPIYKIKIISI